MVRLVLVKGQPIEMTRVDQRKRPNGPLAKKEFEKVVGKTKTTIKTTGLNPWLLKVFLLLFC